MGVAEALDSMRLWGRWGRRWAGESSRCEDPAPTGGIAIRIAPNAIVSMPYTMPHMETYGFYYDAARRVATSFDKRENRL